MENTKIYSLNLRSGKPAGRIRVAIDAPGIQGTIRQSWENYLNLPKGSQKKSLTAFVEYYSNTEESLIELFTDR